jgi:hypothetical protein
MFPPYYFDAEVREGEALKAETAGFGTLEFGAEFKAR